MARNKFDADEEIERKFDAHIIMRLMKWIKPYRGWMIFSCFLMLLSSAISLTSPYLIRMAIDKNKLIRFFVIDKCLRNRSKHYFLDDPKNEGFPNLLDDQYLPQTDKRNLSDEADFLPEEDYFRRI